MDRMDRVAEERLVSLAGRIRKQAEIEREVLEVVREFVSRLESNLQPCLAKLSENGIASNATVNRKDAGNGLNAVSCELGRSVVTFVPSPCVAFIKPEAKVAIHGDWPSGRVVVSIDGGEISAQWGEFFLFADRTGWYHGFGWQSHVESFDDRVIQNHIVTLFENILAGGESYHTSLDHSRPITVAGLRAEIGFLRKGSVSGD